MTKPEVVEYLGKSKRSIEMYVAAGRLKVKYFSGNNGKTALFERAEVEAFKQVLTGTWDRVIDLDCGPKSGSPAKLIQIEKALVPAPTDSRVDSISDAILLSLLRGVPAAQPTMPGPFVGLADAVAISGMPASWLLAQARAGVPWAVNVGTGKKAFWRFAVAKAGK